MALQPGSTVGAYAVVSLLGQGGMGEVYRARDSRLNRDVALKVLPAPFAADASRVARFEREAQLLASLNHPGIAAIYGVEHSDEGPVLVLELVEGITLADRLAAGPLALDDVLRVAQQLAIALEAAHEKGVVHRDLKPANIKVTASGQVKVLDFGLAKMLAPESDSTPLADSPTMSLRATRAGEILGTAAYMSPEQARGRALDRRTDVWSFGCVLFEMLTGAAPFSGATVSDIIAAILKSEPAWKALPADTPPPIERLLKRCLVKDQARRLRDMGDAQIEIADAIDGSPAERPGVVNAPPSLLKRIAWPMAAVALSLLTFVVTRTYVASPEPSSPVIHSTIPWPGTFTGGNPGLRSAISPDGRAVAFIATESAPESRKVWVRPFDSATPRPVPGTERADTLFWSADSRSVGFYADRKLKRVAIAGGTPFTMCECFSEGGTWSKDGVVLLRQDDVIARISDAGGTPRPVTVLDRDNGETRHDYPVFLPDGQHFVFVAFRGLQTRGTFIGALESTDRVPLVEGALNTKFARGFVVFVKGTALMAQAFDPVTRVLSGDARPVVEQINILPDGSTAFSVTEGADVLTYGPVGGTDRRFLDWHDRTGKRLQTIDAGAGRSYWDAHLSKDGRYLSLSLLAAGTGGGREIWIFDTLRNRGAPFTDDPGSAQRQVWSADGARLAFVSTRNGRLDVYEKVVATGQERLLVAGVTAQKYLHDWSDDDRYLVYSELTETGRNDLWVVALADTAKPIAFQHTRAIENFAQFSPDAKWIAFQSDESGALEVYVAPFPGPGRRQRVSSNGGIQPRWRGDGKELFYLSAGQLMAVDVKSAQDAFDVGEPKPLFDLPGSFTAGWRYDVSPDGQRFLVGREESDGPAAASTSLIMNWTELLKR